MPRADIAILTVIPEEYEAVIASLLSYGCSVAHDPGSATVPNLFGWVTGDLAGAGGQVYRVVVGVVGKPGPGRMASAVTATYARYKPQYVLIVGIAGGLPQDQLAKGDVAISGVIYDYEYGKVATNFQPRMDFTYQADQTLLTSAVSLHARDKSWAMRDRQMRPDGGDIVPKLLPGAIASGGKVVDDATNDFFAAVLKTWPKLLAVEMEGAGAAAAIETAKAAKQKVGFLMVRGISDMPKLSDDAQPAPVPHEGNRAERDKWKRYAATTAANFTVHWISRAWPLAPRPTKRPKSSAPSEDGDDGDPPGAPSVASDAAGMRQEVSNCPNPETTGVPLAGSLRQRNSYFVGRETLLKDVWVYFQAPGRVGTAKVQVLSGLGGVGKTQIALEYAYRHIADYQKVFWVNAATELTIAAGFAQMAELLELPEAASRDRASAVSGAKRWLAEEKGWLLILDNADSPAFVPPYIVTNYQGHYLLTSRSDQFDEMGVPTPINVGVLTVEEATEFLLTRTGKSHGEGEEYDAAAEVAEELGELPLALEQAGSYIASRKTAFTSYLTAYRSRRLELLSKGRPKTGDYKESVATTWSLNLEAVAAESAASAELLTYSAFLAPDNIPFELIVKGSDFLGGPIEVALKDFYANHDETLVDELLYPLTKYSLIEKNAEYRLYSVHRLVQEVIKGDLGAEEARAKRMSLIRALELAFPIVSYEYWPLCARLLSHAIAVVSVAPEDELLTNEAGTLHHRIAHYLEETGDYHLSYSVYDKAITIREKHLGPNDADLGTSVNNQGLVLHKLGNSRQAEPVLRRALAIREKAWGGDHPDVSQTLNNLALAVAELGRLDEGEKLLRRAKEILDNQSDEDYFEAKMTALANLTGFLSRRDKNEEAEGIVRDVVARRESKLGLDHPSVAYVLCHLAKLTAQNGKLDEALGHIERALAIQADTIGRVHPDHGRAHNIYGTILEALDRHADALVAYQTAGDIIAFRNGPDHPDIAMVLSNMGHCYGELDDWDKAIEHYRRAMGLLRVKKVGGLMLATVSNNLGHCFIRKRDGYNAKACFELAIEIRRRVLGDTHNDVATATGSLALVEERIGNPERAAELYLDVERIYRDLGLPKIEDHRGFLRNYVIFLNHAGKAQEAAVVRARLHALWPDEPDSTSDS